MKSCNAIRAQFSAYLDGAMTGVTMQEVASHLESCAGCSREFAAWRRTQQMLTDLGPAKAPADLALRLRVAISQEQSHTPKQSLARWQVRWQNTLAPFLLRASAGFASAVLLIGSAALLIGAFAAPEAVEARDQQDAASSPKFLYSMNESNAPELGLEHTDGAKNADEAKVSVSDDSNSVIVEAYVNSEGRVYDYHIISGPHDAAARAQVENLLLFSIFEPARVFGEPVRGIALVSFYGISVQG